jgi:zinc/manganese transport system substrate-binding protein/manganese/iron transport system substrate-binding protein
LDETDAYIRSQIETIPKEQRKLVTFHDAFPYFARAYGLELTGYVVRAPGREPSAQEIKTLSDTLRRQQVRAVFKEPQLNARLLERAAKDAGVRVEVLYSDALTKEITSYVQMMRLNADTIARGLR